MGQAIITGPASSQSRRGLQKHSSSRQVKVRIKKTQSAPKTVANRYKPKTQVVNVQEQNRSSVDPLSINCRDITKFLEDGPCGFRTLTAVGALFSFIAACLDYVEEEYYGVELLFFIATIYILVFSVFIMTLDFPPFHFSISMVHSAILKYARVLRYTWGRGFLYLFSGSIQLSLLTLHNVIAGIVMILLGLISIYLGRRASTNLNTMSKKINSKDELDKKFATFDRDGDGLLNPREFSLFVKSLGINDMPFDDICHIFTSLDKNYDKRLSLKDIQSWWFKYRYLQRENGVNLAV